jgi:hypothetical protein
MNARSNHAVHSARLRATAVAAIALLASSSWATGSEVSGADAASRIGASLPVAEFRTDAAIAERTWARAAGFAGVLAGEPVQVLDATGPAAPSHAQFQVRTHGSARYLANTLRSEGAESARPQGTDAEVAAGALATITTADRANRIRVTVDNDKRDLLAVHGAVADDFGSRWDVGSARARSVFESTLRALSSTQLIAEEGLAQDDVRAARLMQGEQAAGGRATTRVKEYLFEVPHAVGGIQIFGAATTVSVHRSGQLASIRTIGPSASLSPARATVTRVVSPEALMQRAVAEHPDAKVVPVGLRYPWRVSGNVAQASRPREVFQVIPTSLIDGRRVNGRAQFVFYSIEDGRAAPLVWPRPNPAAQGDEREQP